MHCDNGLLQAYQDGELSGDQRAAVVEHLEVCQFCQAELAAIGARVAGSASHLIVLDPRPEQVPLPGHALARLRALQPAAASTPWEAVTRRVRIMSSEVKDRAGLRRVPMQWRAAAVGVLALAVVVAMFSIAPAREAMAQFLGIFRVQRFAVVRVEPERVAQLESLHDALDSGVLGEPTIIRDASRPQPVADAAAGEAAAGFDVREPADVPEGTALQEVSVGVGPHVKLDVERSRLEAVLAMAGMQDIALPPFDTVSVDVDIPALVAQRFVVTNPYGDRDAEFSLVQAPSPAVDLPDGLDPVAMGEVLLLVLGVEPDDAQRMAQAIDWTSTLVLPFPADMGSFNEVEVDGVQGLLLEQNPGSPDYKRAKLLMWQRDGMVYALESENMAAAAMKQIADSLR